MRVLSTSLACIFFLIVLCPTLGLTRTALKCQIKPPANEGCSPHVLLENGELTLDGEGSFVLAAQYTACYHLEEVSVKGKVQRRSYPGGYSLELLATEIIHKHSKITEKFPRTIGIITLQEALLQGRFIDTWAPLRTSGILQPNPTPREISCVSAYKES